MFSTSLITVCLAGAATAFTPPGFEPSSTQDLAVGFGSTAAMNGVNVQKEVTNEAPQLGTAMKLSGTYTLMMVDADIPPQQAGGPTSELLHWMQPGLVSAETQSEVAGMKVFALENPKNVSALATYLPPNPPNKTPTSHRYVQLLLNTTELEITKNVSTLMKEAASRGNFDAVGVLKANGLTVLMGNSFNVTNAEALGDSRASNSTGAGSAGASGGGRGSGGAAGTGVSARPAGTLTTDVLLSTRAPGQATPTVSARPSAATGVTAAPKAAGPINSATLTFDVLISTGGAQAPGAAQPTNQAGAQASQGTNNGTTFAAGASSNGPGGVSVLLAGLGAFVVAVVVL